MKNNIIKKLALGLVVSVTMLMVSACGSENNSANPSVISATANQVFKDANILPGTGVLPSFTGNVTSMVSDSNGVLYASSGLNAYKWINESWVLVNSSMPDESNIQVLYFDSNNVLFAATANNDVYESVNGAWASYSELGQITNQSKGSMQIVAIPNSSKIFVLTNNKIYSSGVDSWKFESGYNGNESTVDFTTISTYGGIVYAGNNKIYQLNGESWISLSGIQTSNNISSMLLTSNSIFFGAESIVYSVTGPRGGTQFQVNNPLPNGETIGSLIEFGGNLFVISNANIYESIAGNWKALSDSTIPGYSSDIGYSMIVSGVFNNNGVIYACNNNSSNIGYVYSLSNGVWSSLIHGGVSMDPNFSINSMNVVNGVIYATGVSLSNGESVLQYKFNEADKTWPQVGTGFPLIMESDFSTNIITNLNGNIFAVTSSNGSSAILGSIYNYSTVTNNWKSIYKNTTSQFNGVGAGNNLIIDNNSQIYFIESSVIYSLKSDNTASLITTVTQSEQLSRGDFITLDANNNLYLATVESYSTDPLSVNYNFYKLNADNQLVNILSGTFPGIVGLFLVDNTANIDLLIANPLTKTNTWYKSNNGSFSSQFNTPFEFKGASAAIYYSN